MNALSGRQLERDLLDSARRARRGIRRHWPWSLTFAVVLPTLLASIYYGVIASPRYVSEAEIVIEADDNASAANVLSSMLGSLGGIGGSGVAIGQAHLLVEYIHSAAILDQMQQMIDIASMYTSPKADFLSRMVANPTREEFLDYYRSAVEVELDTASRILKIRAEAFAPDEAKLIVQTILVLSEDLLNRMLLRKQNDIVSFARKEVEMAEARLMKARTALADFRRENIDIDPTRSAQAQGTLIADLTSQLAQARAELTSSLAFLKPESTQIKALIARIGALEKQISEEQARLVAGNDGTINARISQYEALLFEHEFAQTAYTSALTFLESSRITSQKQRSYVIDFVEPNLPEEPLRPERVKAILTVLVVSFITWSIGSLLAGAIRENSRA